MLDSTNHSMTLMGTNLLVVMEWRHNSKTTQTKQNSNNTPPSNKNKNNEKDNQSTAKTDNCKSSSKLLNQFWEMTTTSTNTTD